MNDRIGTNTSLWSHEIAKHIYFLKSNQTSQLIGGKKKGRVQVYGMAIYDETKEIYCI